MKAFAADPQYAFPGQGQMKPEQFEIERLWREVTKLKAERGVATVADFAHRGKPFSATLSALPTSANPIKSSLIDEASVSSAALPNGVSQGISEPIA